MPFTDLRHVDEGKVYVLGGMVDHLLDKCVSFRRADSFGILTAKLPILEYFKREKPYSTVFSVNQVFDTLLRYRESHDWTASLLEVIPRRKGYHPH
eukprot:m.97150 g.97150  ORF g.97150 m.97150 type:complete len:96 (+) comp36930_c0_seq2:462-749(+)